MSHTTVRDLMTSPVFTVDQDREFTSADDMMRLQHIRHVPVVSKGNLVGLVTHRDLMRAQAKLFLDEDGDDTRLASVRVGDFMTTDRLTTCDPSTPADDAARLMLTKKIGCVLVQEGDRLVGILTESDLVSWAVEMMAKTRLEQARGTTPPPKGA